LAGLARNVKIKLVHDTLLRGAWCVVWMASAVMALGFFMEATTASPEDQHFYFVRMFICCGCGLLGICMHAHLLMEHGRAKEKDDDI
jgi:hypothetical protein